MNSHQRKWLFGHCVFGILLVGAFAQPSLSSAGDLLAPIDLRQVQIGGEMGRQIDVTINNNMLVVNTQSFLEPFRTKTATNENYIGLGKLIDAAVTSAAYTKDSRVIALKTSLVDELLTQQLSDGYIGVMAPSARMWTFWDIHEMSYIVSGLMNDFRYFNNQSSLNAARKAADYMISHWSEKPANWPLNINIGPDMPIIGTDDAMMRLYRATSDRRYLDFSVKELGLSTWNQEIVSTGRSAPFYGHAYAYLTRSLAQLELHRVQPNASLLGQTRRAVDFLTNRNGMTITGAFGKSECWSNDQSGDGELGETCATAYAIRNYDGMLRLQGDSRYGDLMERTILNTLYAAHSPDGRQIRYYTPEDGPRTYFGADTYCCPGNFRRIVAELPEMVYYKSGAGLAVNLYTPSTATIDLEGGISLNVTQTGEYVESGQVTLRLDPSQSGQFPLQLRIPEWCGDDVSVTVNGETWDAPISPGKFLTIDRQWNAGDEVTLHTPMNWRFVLGRETRTGLAALMRGPVVYCLDPSQNEFLKDLDVPSLNSLTIDPTSVTDLPGGDTFGGMACQVQATGFGQTFSLKLTTFPDPAGKCTYFHLTDLSAAVPDELVGVFPVPEPQTTSLVTSGCLFALIAYAYGKRR